MLTSFIPSLSIPWPNPLLTRALTKMKSLRCVRSFSFSNTTPSLFWTRWDLMSCRTKGRRMGHTGLCSKAQSHQSTFPGQALAHCGHA